ncbi:transcriptional regulator with XRE-family HTH domain [Epilithonimonas hungarica]|uniref:helix-turn-helix domain-containing protein n=1 Tax=Epilithonimonas hungarica TaxID=454006 RepID=UPI00278AAA3D|nr:helix-turn-helix domain-containing protein [Epilithonimonas hungarica]MDP9956122.1 transcriptional regulator with XRE-family HTH domain [Epilithonimonas hungarica]
MSELKKIREEKNLTQEELAEKSGLSVRTIQRIEAGTEPKGYTLKTLASSLDVSESDLLIPNIPIEPSIEEPILETEDEPIENLGLIKIINLSSLPLCWFPIANFLPPLLVMLISKHRSPIIKQIISLQVILAIIAPIIFFLVAFLKLGNGSVMVTMISLTLANVYIILRNAYELDKKQSLYYKLNFSIL